MMKKYLLITALCAANLAYADGFENLKNLQNQFHVVIYNAGDLGAAAPAPEVPYIAGLLTNPVQSIGTGEERHIYESLYDQPLGRNRKAIPGIDQAKANAFNTINFTNFQQYGSYQNSGHSVLGIAAQEQLPPIEKVTIMSAVPRASPIVVNSSSSSSNAPTGAGLFAGGGGSFELPKLRRATTKEPSTSVAAAAAPKSLLERVREHKKTLKNKVDIELLTELEGELSRGASEASPASGRHNDLVEFFNLLTTQGPGLQDVNAQHALDNNIKTLRGRLTQNNIVASSPPSASPKGMKMAGVNLDEAHVNQFMRKASGSALGPVKKAANSGNAEVDELKKALEALKERKEELEQADSDEDWDDEDEKQKKSAEELKQEQEELERVNAQILEKAEELAMHPQGRLDGEAVESSNNRIAIYQRIKEYLDTVENKTTQQQQIHLQVINKLTSMNGNLGTKAPGLKSTVPAVAPLIHQPSAIVAPGAAFNIDNQAAGGGGLADDIDAQVEQKFAEEKMAIETEIEKLQEELGRFNQKERRDKGTSHQSTISALKTRLQAYTNEGKIQATKMGIKNDLNRAAKKK